MSNHNGLPYTKGILSITIAELIHNMSQLNNNLSDFEEKFGVKSSYFYKAINAGELEEFDALDEYRLEFIKWLSLYKMWLSLQEKYQQLITRQPIAIQIKTSVRNYYGQSAHFAV